MLANLTLKSEKNSIQDMVNNKDIVNNKFRIWPSELKIQCQAQIVRCDPVT